VDLPYAATPASPRDWSRSRVELNIPPALGGLKPVPPALPLPGPNSAAPLHPYMGALKLVLLCHSHTI
jgi:hypothetical protein